MDLTILDSSDRITYLIDSCTTLQIVKKEYNFNQLKETLISVPILRYPDINEQFLIRTDACELGIGERNTQYTSLSKNLKFSKISNILVIPNKKLVDLKIITFRAKLQKNFCNCKERDQQPFELTLFLPTSYIQGRTFEVTGKQFNTVKFVDPNIKLSLERPD
ncbi:hypothetical protein H8356DRAFT_1328978 [Neocallimastix lanati (nom. inval.)]|nr:hypothetical protein H8356DRAFT_1328978 [Neocallimastix sp. JGI-2020a]